MSQLLESRARILTALETNGIRTATTGKLAAPCVIVEPGDPWSAPDRMPGRIARWRLTAVGGRSDSEGTLALLGELVDGANEALRTLRDCQAPTWARPFDLLLDGVTYGASVSTIQISSS
jgi:hypothetical protein